MPHPAPDGTRANRPRGRSTRRRFLGALGAGATAVTGLAGLPGARALSKVGGLEEAPDDYPMVATRGHFDDDAGLVDGETETSYDVVGDWDAHSDDDDAELVVVVHGWTLSEGEAPNVAYTCQTALENEGYDEFVVGYSWDADRGDTVDFGWADAKAIADRNGPKLATFVTDWRDRFGLPVRLVGHSLGARVVGAGLNALHDGGHTDGVASAVFLGGAVDDEEASYHGDYGDAIAAVPERFDNYHKDDDAVLDGIYELREWDEAIGEDGVAGWAPENYADHDVTHDVVDHNAYYLPEKGCIPQVVDNF